MKNLIALLLALCMVFALTACGAEPAAPAEAPRESETPAEMPAETETPEPEEVKDWSREGVFGDDNENMLSIVWMEEVDEPGWYVGGIFGQTMAGAVVKQEGNTLRGNLNAWEEGAEPFVVTVTEEGEDGVMLAVEGGETYHFKPMELPKATIIVTVNTEGWGNIDYAEGEEAPEIDPNYPFQSAQINLAEPAVYTLVAWPREGNRFVKWTRNGEDFSAEAQIQVNLDESADYVAVFEEDPDWQDPLLPFVGEYQSGRAHARVQSLGNSELLIVIEWGGSVSESAQWIIFGRLDLETMTITYADCTKSILTYGEDGEVKSEEVEYEDGTGTVVFGEGPSFTWHEDQSVYEEDMVFEWLQATEE